MSETFNFECKTPANVAATLSKTICVQKTNASFMKLLILGILAGVYIGFGAAFATLVSSDAITVMGLGVGKIFTGAVFSTGLMLVVIAGAELFTGNNLMLMSVMNGEVPLHKVLWKWLIVYVANFLGALLLVYIMFNTNLWKGNDMATGINALKLANYRVNLSFAEAFFRGVLCNWLVCLAVWMALASKDVIGKIWAILFPIMTFVALGLEHCIANMYFIPMGIMLKATDAAAASKLDLTNLTWSGFANHLVPVTLGNIVGGAFFVGFLYWFVYVRPENKTA